MPIAFRFVERIADVSLVSQMANDVIPFFLFISFGAALRTIRADFYGCVPHANVSRDVGTSSVHETLMHQMERIFLS